MKFIKTMILAGFLLGTAGMCLQAQEESQVRVIQGAKARMVVLETLKGTNMAKLSRNEEYIYGDIGENGAGGYIYNIATGKLNIYEGFGIVEVIDTNNYVASNHIMKNGQRIEFKKQNLPTDAQHDYGAVLASADLNTIAYDTYIGVNYVTVLFDGDGNIIDTMPHYETGLSAGYGSFALAMSEDGKMLSGRTSIERAHTNFSPAIWDRNAKKTIATVGNTSIMLDGSLYGINEDGTIAVGEVAELPHWIEYDKASQEYTLHEIATFPGYRLGWGATMKGNVVLGLDQLDNVSVYERVPWLYNIQTEEKVSFKDHMLYRYGLEEDDDYGFFTVISMSKNHKTFVGYSYNGSWFPYVITLENEQVHPVVRNVSIWQPYRENYVQLQWEKPINGDYTVAGYKIYCDSLCIETISDPDTTSYRHENPAEGPHNYQIQACYTDGESSNYSAEKKIIVVGEGGCLPVQEITANVIYNRTVELSWGRPSANILQKSASRVRRAEERTAVTKSGSAPEPKYKVEGKLDYVSLKDMLSEHAAVAVRVGDYLYVGNYRTNVIAVYDAISGNLQKNVQVADLNGMYDMTYHNRTLYCVGNKSPKVTMLSIDARDPLKITNAGSWSASSELTHITYLEGLNNGEDMIMTGNFNTVMFYKADAADASDVADFSKNFENLKDMTIIGTAYHNGRIYFANQHDGNSSMIETYDWESGKHLFTTDLVAIPAVYNAVAADQGYSALQSGISIGTLDDGTVVLDAMVQPQVVYNQLVTVEIESSPDVKGFNIYRDGEKVADTVKARHWSQEIFEPGKYVYTVEYVSNNGCSMRSEGFAEDSAIIDTIGTCMPPTKVAVFESNKIVSLSWELPEKITDPSLVGFNVYRNGEQLYDKTVDLRLQDAKIEKGTEYIYRVEAFYNNSCVASDTVKITPTFEGYAAAPFGLNVTNHEDGDSWAGTVTWELPVFEDPLSLGYCGGTAGGAVNLPGSNTVFCLIGWTQQDNDLDPYKDLYVVGVEFMLGAQPISINGVVYIDDKLVWSEPVRNVEPDAWKQHFFNKSFSMDQKMEVAVGYAFTYDPDNATEGIIKIDLGPAVPGKGDILSYDGVNVSSLYASGVDANLMINALVVRKRDLEQAAKMENGMEYIKKKAFVATPLNLIEYAPITNAPKATSEKYTLKGFNVYRDGEKRNKELLRTFSFEDPGLEVGKEYEYVVSAVYADEEVKSESFWLTGVSNSQAQAVCPVSFLPNPVQDMLYIKGEYASLSIIDMTGRVVLSDVRNAQSLSMANFQSGIYFMKVTTENGQVYITKIVKK